MGPYNNRVQGAAAKVWAMSGRMESRINARNATKSDIEAILWKAYNVYMDANKQSNNKKKMVIQLCTHYNANPDKFAECATE